MIKSDGFMPGKQLQDTLDMSRNVHDLGSLDKLRQAAKTGDKAALMEASKQFEGIFINMMIKSMRKASDVLADEDSPMNSQQVSFYRDMHDKQMATSMATNSSMGLANVIYQQFGGDDSFTPSTVIRSDGNLADLQRNPHLRVSTQVPVNSESSNTTHNNKKTAQSTINTQSMNVTKTAAFTSPEDFVSTLYPVLEDAAESIGLAPKALLAQAAVETGWGKYMFHTNNANAHNLFGIKAHNGWSGDKVQVPTLEYTNGTAKKVHAEFRQYDSFADAANDYVKFLQDNPRYKTALANTDSPKEYFTELQKAGYATDPDYARKVLHVLDSKTMQDAVTMAGSASFVSTAALASELGRDNDSLVGTVQQREGE